MVATNIDRIARLGNWPAHIDAAASLMGRIPEDDGTTAPGFDAGIACALDIIPQDKQRLSAILHAAYTPEAVMQVRREAATMDPDSETCWWLAACRVCEEDGVGAEEFCDQVGTMALLALEPESRRNAAIAELEEMCQLVFYDVLLGVPFGMQDGCIQGAYLSGNCFGTRYSEKNGLWYIGTYLPSLGLESFPWSDAKDERGRAKSGPNHGSRQFVTCATKEEFRQAVAVVRAYLL